MNPSQDDLFEEIIELPERRLEQTYAHLVGLDDIKSRLVREARVLMNPALLDQWSLTAYGKRVDLVDTYLHRPPLFVFAGDVGCGKTALAESFGAHIARSERLAVTLYRLSLNARGTGAVGEMTRLIAAAFQIVRSAGEGASAGSSRARSAIVLVIDEADALAQSREMTQMHHEDRAGVNALIRGIDDLAGRNLPIVVVMCTNRPDAIDPAVRRRSAAIFEFGRPSVEQRRHVLELYLSELGFSPEQLTYLATATGEQEGRLYGATYSDLVQRYLPTLLLDALPDKVIRFDHALATAFALQPTRPFAERAGP